MVCLPHWQIYQVGNVGKTGILSLRFQKFVCNCPPKLKKMKFN